jgi:riboflavin biosynthesis pyrimidine reductase
MPSAADSEHAKPDYTNLDLVPPPDDRPTVLVNMVMSTDGKVVIGGTERGLGSPTDQRLMRELRVNADVVLNGAGTLRASGTSSRIDQVELEAIRLDRGKPAAPIAAVISRSGDLPLDRAFFTSTDFPAVVYLADSAPADRRDALQATGRPVYLVPTNDAIVAALRHMRTELQAQVLLVEGGPTINGQLFQRDLVDHYFLTLSPTIVGGRDILTPVQGDAISTPDHIRRLTLIAAHPNAETGEVYLHYARAPKTSA